MQKHRATVFTRMLIFLLIFLPLAFIGVTKYQGKDPMVELKKLIGDKNKEQPTNYSKTSEEMTIEILRQEVSDLKTQLIECQQKDQKK